MCADTPSIDRRRPARTSADYDSRVRAAFDLIVSRGVAFGSPSTGLVIAVLGIRIDSPALLGLAAATICIGALAVWQLRTARPNAIALIVPTVAGIGIASLFVPREATPAMAAAVVVFALTGVLAIHGRRATWHTALAVVAFVARPLQLLLTRTVTDGDLLAYSILTGVFAFGYGVLTRMSREMRSTEEQYRFLFEHAPVALWDNDLTGVVEWMDRLRAQGVDDLREYLDEHPAVLDEGMGAVVSKRANRAVAALLHTPDPDDLVGHLPPPAVTEDSRRFFAEQFCALWDGRTEGEIEHTGVRMDGTEFRAVFTWAIPPDGGAGTTRGITAAADTTDLHEIEAELESTETMRRALLHAIPDLLFICDADGTYLNYHVPDRSMSTNTARREDLYVPPSQFLGRRPHDVLPPDLAERMMIAIATSLETGSVQHLEYELPIDGEQRHWEMRVSPIERESRVLTLVRDITDAMQARIELERLIESKDDFIAAVSHEIRTPLTGIVGFASLLNGEDESLEPEERRAMIEALADQSADLTNIVEDLLVAAKADLGRLAVAEVPIDLRAQVAQVVEAWDPGHVHQPEIVGAAPRCVGDPHRVRQVIRNLLTNARRYGGNRIRIEIGAGPAMGEVVVTDDGPGIPPERIAQAFLPYRRVAEQDGLTAALGIGLPISRTLASLMGGELSYERADGETRFRLTIPLADPAGPVSAHRGDAPAGVFGRHDTP